MLAQDALAGTELMVAALLAGSEGRDVRHELATLDAAGPVAARVRAGGVEAVSLGGRGGWPAAVRRLGALLRSRDYDVVTAYGFKASITTRLLVRALQPGAAFVCGVRGRHVTDVEHAGSPKARLAAVVERALAPLVDVYDANSRAAIDLLAGLGIGAERLVHIPNGIDLSAWTPSERAGGEAKPPVIVCAGRIVAYKRQRDLLQALAQLHGEGRDFRAILAGDGPDRGEMRTLAARLGLADRVDLPGSLPPEEVGCLLADATIACLPSAGEGMPGSVMEAMAAGVPVVATDVSGTNELVLDGESGLLVPAYDPPALAGAIARLLDDPGLRARLGRAGRARIEERYSLEAMVSAKESLYRELAQRVAQRRS